MAPHGSTPLHLALAIGTGGQAITRLARPPAVSIPPDASGGKANFGAEACTGQMMGPTKRISVQKTRHTTGGGIEAKDPKMEGLFGSRGSRSDIYDIYDT